ncbi:MAG: hypothetical protein EXR07_21315 [Acetobacteraceae bacterium]|nr:hypothetical protein [Acetobacteraceae bacterium]
MRKLLLASAAMLGATSGIASAQGPSPAGASLMMQPSQGQIALPWSSGPSVNNNNNTLQASGYVGGAKYGTNAVPTPGTVVIRLNGRFEAEMIAAWSTNHKVSLPASANAGTVSNAGVATAGVTVPAWTAQANPITLNSYIRFYPGVDGMATNGLRYGAGVELRVNVPGSAGQPAPAPGAAATAASGIGGAAPGPSTYNTGQTVYVRRAFGYVAADSFGLLRYGITDGVISLFDPGIFSGAGIDGGMGSLNGAAPQGSGVTGAFGVPYVLAQAGAEYGNAKIVYLTPQFFGFDLGIQYAPSMGNGFSSCAQAGFACNSATSGNDPTRWYNQVAVGARWQGAMGPVALGIYGLYETASKESFTGGAPTLSGGAQRVTGNRYDNLSFVSIGAYGVLNSGIGAITASLTYQGGAVNNQLAMRPTGGASQNQFVGGLQWRNGPLVVGTQFNIITSQGAAQLTGVSQRNEFALAVAATYSIAPGLNVWAEYQYARRHQGGFDFVTGAVPTATTVTRDGKGQAAIIGTSVSW